MKVFEYCIITYDEDGEFSGLLSQSFGPAAPHLIVGEDRDEAISKLTLVHADVLKEIPDYEVVIRPFN